MRRLPSLSLRSSSVLVRAFTIVSHPIGRESFSVITALVTDNGGSPSTDATRLLFDEQRRSGDGGEKRRASSPGIKLTDALVGRVLRYILFDDTKLADIADVKNEPRPGRVAPPRPPGASCTLIRRGRMSTARRSDGLCERNEPQM